MSYLTAQPTTGVYHSASANSSYVLVPSTPQFASGLSHEELNKQALDAFLYQPVNREMIQHIALAASEVIDCDPFRRPNESDPLRCSAGGLPTLEEFITQLVISSNVQVPTLMSTLVYLRRLKSRLAPMAKGLRCTTHRIFLAALIIAAKYLNDSSPKNKHWAAYSNITTPEAGGFGFSKTEVNLMERQLLLLLNYDLRFTTEDLYRELEGFLAPLRTEIDSKYVRRQQRREREMEYAARRYPTPPSSRSPTRSPPSSRNRDVAPTYMITRQMPESPESLTYSSASSYSSSLASSRDNSRETTPLSDHGSDYVCIATTGVSASPEVVIQHQPSRVGAGHGQSRKLAYEITEQECYEIENAKHSKRQRILGRVLGARSAY